ncbi:MAG: protein-L-isoaspartate O-methyltransferase, partial [Candidatus Nanohaloarchaea archaeon]|nr:protein-L-isoaspartate O-methyltransferase [Candidatus Nanohaloarchaea archaeon]
RLGSYDNVTVLHRDGREGLPEEAPFDRIMVTAAPDELPDALGDQLREGGRLVVPVGGSRQRLKILEKRAGNLEEVEDWGGVRFVPMKEGPD